MKGKGRTSICIDCEKSGGLCPWSAKLKPVAGWTATPVKRDTNGRYKKGLHITECPMFEKTQRKASVQPWTDEEIDELQEMIRQKARYKDIAVILGRSYRAVQFKVLELQRERRSKENESD